MENAASRFGQHLAHTEKKYRDRALKKLTVYLTKKKDWTDLEWDKLWKALFYCMWMSDKRPVQEELSSNLAALVHKVPEPEAALEFVHSFFRTMHREWHGLDGLRLDKFYSLVRKFVRESIALLRVQDWDEEIVQEFVTILSSEVVSQLPNGLRMHLADLYLTEIYNAAGKDVTTEAFVTLLEPFFTLLSGEYDKTVFKRVKELVFEDMMTKYKFGPQPEKEDEEETDEEEQEEDKVFELVDVAQVQHRIFAIASADDTAERNRSALYTLYKKFFTVTHIDSFQAAQEVAAKPTKKTKKEKKQKKQKEEETPKIEESPKTAEDAVEKKSKKSKKRKAKKDVEAEAEVKIEEVKEEKTEAPVKKKSKKQKIATEAKDEDVEMKTPPVKSEKSKKKQKRQEEAMKAEKVEKKGKVEKVEKAKKEEKKTKETAPTKEPSKPKQEKTEKKESYTSVTKSGKKFKRCGSCGGFGKGLVPKDKLLCGHCERTQKTQKKKTVSASKKRKAESQAQAAREEQEKAESGKKVTFGKSKALRHEVSVKRLRASAKRDSVSKETEDIKGVLKATTPSPVASKKSKKTKSSKGRKMAADFF